MLDVFFLQRAQWGQLLIYGLLSHLSFSLSLSLSLSLSFSLSIFLQQTQAVRRSCRRHNKVRPLAWNAVFFWNSHAKLLGKYTVNIAMRDTIYHESKPFLELTLEIGAAGKVTYTQMFQRLATDHQIGDRPSRNN
jgi:hypothetical protein